MSSCHVSDKVGIVRKPHNCRVCYGRIEKGEECHIYTGVEQGEGFYTLHFHNDCWEYSRKWDDWEWENHTPGDVSRSEIKELTA